MTAVARRRSWVGPLVVLLGLALVYRDGLLGRHWLTGDNGFQNFPWHCFVARCAAAGEPGRALDPVPEMALGLPLWAEPQSCVCYPLNTAWWPGLPLFFGFTLEFYLHLLLGAAGFWSLARSLRLRPPGAAAATIVFSTGSFAVHRIVHPPILFTICWTPWIAVAVRAGCRGWQPGWALATVAQALQLLIGHPQMVIPTALMAVVAGATTGPGGAGRRLGRAAGGYAVVVGSALLLTLVSWVGALEHTAQGHRTGASTVGFLTQWGATFAESLVNLVGGLAIDLKHEKTAFAGTVALIAALLALVSPRLRRWRPWLALALLGLLLAWGDGNPVYRLLVHVPLVNRFRGPSRYAVLWTCGGALLVGALVDQLGRVDRRRWLLAAGGAVAALLGAALLAHRLGGGLVARGLAAQLMVAAGTAALGWLAADRRRRPAAQWLLVLVVAGELAGFAAGVNPSQTAAEWRQGLDNRLLEAVVRHRQDPSEAYLGWLGKLPDNRSLVYQVPQVLAYTGMPFPGVQELCSLLYGPVRQPVLSALGITWVGAKFAPGDSLGLERVELIDRAGDWYLWRNPTPVPRAYVPRELVQATAESVWDGFNARAPDPSVRATMDVAFLPPDYQPGVGGTAEVVLDTTREVRVRSRSTVGHLVVLTRAWAADWSAFVDGRPTDALRVNVTLLGAPVPPGDHEVVFRYEPSALLLGRQTLLAWLLLPLAATLVARRQRRPQTSQNASQAPQK